MAGKPGLGTAERAPAQTTPRARFPRARGLPRAGPVPVSTASMGEDTAHGTTLLEGAGSACSPAPHRLSPAWP